MLKFFLLFTTIPVIEMIIILNIHDILALSIGSGNATLLSIGIVLLTGMLGAKYARAQGMEVVRRLQKATAAGQIPSRELAEGVLVLIGGVLLITPGYLTDIFGFSLLMPATRSFYVKAFSEFMKQKISSGQFQFHYAQSGGFSNTGFQQTGFEKVYRDSQDAIDVEAVDLGEKH